MMQPPAQATGFDDTNQVRVVLWQSGRFVHAPLTGLGTLGALAGLTPTDGGFVVGDGSTWVVESGATARTSLGLSASDPSGFLPGQVVQEVVQTRGTDDSTTSATFTNTGLSASITPLLSDSVIEAMAILPLAQVGRVSGSPVQRRGQFRIRNSTNSVNGPSHDLGRILVTGSTAGAESLQSTLVYMRYTVDSTTSRTFVLDFRVVTATDTQLTTNAAASEITMILREIKQ